MKTKIPDTIGEYSKNRNALIGPIKPIIPKPADSFVPPVPMSAPPKPVMIAFVNTGSSIIGCLIMLGNIIFTPPRKIVSGTPARFTFIVPHTSTASAATTPIDAEPAASPLIPIASEIATVDNGEMMMKLYDSAIKIDMRIGCNSVK